MFKDSQLTHLDAWGFEERSDSLPAVGYPAFVGTGKLGLGLDAAGLQSLPDRLGAHYHTHSPGYHVCQSDLYVLREGMISSHLWHDEFEHTGVVVPTDRGGAEVRRNFMPLGWLDLSFTVNGHGYAGDDLRRFIKRWHRSVSLSRATVRTRYGVGLGHVPDGEVEVEAFAPIGGESVYLRLHRSALARVEGDFHCTIGLNLSTRHGLELFDQPGSVSVADQVIEASIDEHSAYCPAEPYTVIYGVAGDAEGGPLDIRCTQRGWSVTLGGKAASPQTCWLRLDFQRLAGRERKAASQRIAAWQSTIEGFDRGTWNEARQEHVADYERFWRRTADIAVTPADRELCERRFVLHQSQYLLRCGNDHGLGGTVQYLLLHQNGWKACNFHDNHYIGDALLRSNLRREAEANVRWMRSVMREAGRPFPWMMTYDGYATTPPERDRAPMSDANRGMLAVRAYELAGEGRDTLLREAVYPIVKAVVEHGLEQWFDEQGDGLHFRAVENDVTGGTPNVDEGGTVLVYLSLLRKACAYAERLGVDGDRVAAWRNIVERYRLPETADTYRAFRDAGEDQPLSPWFLCAAYVGEAHPFVEAEKLHFAMDRDTFGDWSINAGWDNARNACAELRLGRPDRAEQLLTHALEQRVYGPGYFEECNPLGRAGLPPFAPAHAAYTTASLEQCVRPEFWRDAVHVGTGMPRRWGDREVRFTNLVGPRGLLLCGCYEPKRLTLELTATGPDWAGDLLIRLPACIGRTRTLTRDGQPLEHRLRGDRIETHVTCPAGGTTTLILHDKEFCDVPR